ncbi:MAG: terminase ATPase subunit family protein [Proteobacteria bacterium]|nr:terminase ATPase subunit family protein [Pseudomonadota bacterium]
MDPASPFDARRRARALFWMGWGMAEISRELNVPYNTLASWKRREKWEAATSLQRVESTLEMRLNMLVMKEQKTGGDFKEIDLLGRQLERAARIRKYESGGSETDLNPAVANRNSGPKKKPEKNVFSDEQAVRLHEAFLDSMFDYQKVWYGAGAAARIRDILKSRQIGATFYFAREALDDAIQTGRNQIFLSASKAQAHQFKSYILQFAREACEVELRGDPIVLWNGAELYFLGTNFRTAQSYHGNLYLDEYFWIPRFLQLRKVASGMASQKRWRQTYFSTPSSITHEAYQFWSGGLFNKGRDKADRVALDLSHAALKDGFKCADGQWRQIVNIMDALSSGCDLFDLDDLKLEYGPEEFQNLFMCQFIDDTQSAFPLTEMQRCFVDSWEVWDDYKPFALRPLGNRPVWVGYDPSHTGDSAGLVVVAPPAVMGGKFRVIEKHQLKGGDFEAQAEFIRKITERFNVTHIAIDSTGLGQGVFQLVKQFFPAARGISYSPEVKIAMVMKAQSVIRAGRLEFDAGWTDLAQSFMAIRKAMTASGRQFTFEASRSEEVSHADMAWACLHALFNEPLEGATSTNQSRMEIFG